MATPNICVHCGGWTESDSFVCDSCCLDAAFDFLGMSEKAPAKSSTSVMQASVCQKCGCKMDGVRGGGKVGCLCKCHEGA
jgi:hypothetical protein